MAFEEPIRSRWPSRRFYLGLIALLPALLIVILFIRFLATDGYIRTAGQVPEQRSQTHTDEEELVRRYILNNADKDAEEIKFLTWGPHMSKQELMDLMKEAGIIELAQIWGNLKREDIKKLEAFKTIIRVRFEGAERKWTLALGTTVDQSGKRKIYDELFMVYGKLVVPLNSGPNLSGKEINNDNWKEMFRNELAKLFPGIKPSLRKEEAPPPTRKEAKAQGDESRELQQWLNNFRAELARSTQNTLRFNNTLHEARKKAQQWTREWTARGTCLAFPLTISALEEDCIRLKTGFPTIRLLLEPLDHKGGSVHDHYFGWHQRIALRIGRDVSKETALPLNVGQRLLVLGEVVGISVEEPDFVEVSGRSLRVQADDFGLRQQLIRVKVVLKNLRLGEKQVITIDPLNRALEQGE